MHNIITIFRPGTETFATQLITALIVVGIGTFLLLFLGCTKTGRGLVQVIIGLAVVGLALIVMASLAFNIHIFH
jgi:hypothetical protein